MSDPTQLEVSISAVAQPHLPLILANSAFLSTLKSVEDQIATLTITDAQSAQNAANLQTRLTDAGKKLNQTRLELKRPFMAQCDAIDAAAKQPSARIETAKGALSRALTAYDEQQKKIAAEAERARKAELARLEEVRLNEEYEAREKAAKLAKELASRPAATQPVWDDEPDEAPPPTATETAIAAVKFAPTAVAAKPSGVRFKTTLVPVVEDLRLLPDAFVERLPKMAALKATFCAGFKDGDPMPVCPGVRFDVSKTVESTGRSAF